MFKIKNTICQEIRIVQEMLCLDKRQFRAVIVAHMALVAILIAVTIELFRLIAIAMAIAGVTGTVSKLMLFYISWVTWYGVASNLHERASDFLIDKLYDELPDDPVAAGLRERRRAKANGYPTQ